MTRLLKPSTYINVVNLPFSNHQMAKELLLEAKKDAISKTSKVGEIKVSKFKFSTDNKRTLQGLFIYSISQMPGYCPADTVHVEFNKDNMIIQYTQNQQFYKGIEEL